MSRILQTSESRTASPESDTNESISCGEVVVVDDDVLVVATIDVVGGAVGAKVDALESETVLLGDEHAIAVMTHGNSMKTSRLMTRR